MAQVAPRCGGRGLSSSPQRALALCQCLFQDHAGLGKLMAALRHVEGAGPCIRGGKWESVSLSPNPQGQEGQGCRLVLELRTVLLQMEQSRRAQKQLLWDLELLTGAGLGLFWPPWAQACRPRGQAQQAQSQPRSGSGREEKQLVHLNSCRGQAPDLGEVRSVADTRCQSPGVPGEPTDGAELEGPGAALTPVTYSSSYTELGNSEFKAPQARILPNGDLSQTEEDSWAEPTTQKAHRQGRMMAEETPESSEGPPEPRDTPTERGSGLSQATAEWEKPVKNQSQTARSQETLRGEGAQSRRAEDAGGQRGGASPGESLGARPSPTGTSPLGSQQRKSLPSWEGAAGELAPGEARAAQPGEEDYAAGRPGDGIAQPQGREGPGPQCCSPPLVQGRILGRGQSRQAARASPEGACTPPPTRSPAAPPLLPGPRATKQVTAQGSGGSEPQQLAPAARDPPEREEEGGARLPGPQAAWPAPAGRERVSESVAQHLQRLLELHCAARRRRRREREQQRLRVLERLCLARNRQCRVHPLGLSRTQELPPQEDAAGWRRALQEQLEQVYRERTWRLRVLRARNTRNFRELLWAPGAEKPAPGE